MSSTSRPPLTPEESRYLDGVLSDAEARHLERKLAADPARAAAIERERQAMDLWRDQAERVGSTLGGPESDLLDRVMGAVARGAPPARRSGFLGRLGLAGAASRPPATSARTAQVYAMAALLLMGIGVGGTWMVRAHRAEATPAGPESVIDPDAPLLDGVAHGVRNGIFRAPPAPRPQDDEPLRKAGDDR